MESSDDLPNFYRTQELKIVLNGETRHLLLGLEVDGEKGGFDSRVKPAIEEA